MIVAIAEILNRNTESAIQMWLTFSNGERRWLTRDSESTALSTAPVALLC
jgi:hypothetical protein